jgi:hypothetical protein
MAGSERTDRTNGPACLRCGAAMKDVVTIQPLGSEPGLIAYECPRCGWVTSELVPPDGDSHR